MLSPLVAGMVSAVCSVHMGYLFFRMRYVDKFRDTATCSGCCVHPCFKADNVTSAMPIDKKPINYVNQEKYYETS